MTALLTCMLHALATSSTPKTRHKKQSHVDKWHVVRLLFKTRCALGAPSTKNHDVFRSILRATVARLTPRHFPRPQKHPVMQWQQVDADHLCQRADTQNSWTARPQKSVRQYPLTQTMFESHANQFELTIPKTRTLRHVTGFVNYPSGSQSDVSF